MAEDLESETSAASLYAERAARVKDLLLGTVLVLLGIASYRMISQAVVTGLIDNQEVDHATLPKIWGVVLVVLVALWMVRTAFELRDVSREMRARGMRPREMRLQYMFPDLPKTLALRMLITVAALVVYAGFLEVVPFALSTGVFLFVLLLAFGQPISKVMIGLSVGGGIGFHLLFVTALKLPLY
jgi:hypothetical protein